MLQLGHLMKSRALPRMTRKEVFFMEHILYDPT
jgi:hypothetical protein